MKMNRTHIVPMSTQLKKLLTEQQSITGDQIYVFASPQRRNTMISKTTLNKMLGYIGLANVTAHDFRATASTALNEQEYDEDWIEMQLAHVSGNKTRASYNHAKYFRDRKKMMQDWANIVDGWSI